MAKTSSVLALKVALTSERRKNRRLRQVIDNVNAELRQNSRELNVQLTRMAQLQVEVDALKQRHLVGSTKKTR